MSDENDLKKTWKILERQAAYVEKNLGAEAHWFFIQGDKAIEQQLYVPGVVSLLHGIEMSLRIVVSEVKQVPLDKTPTFSNSLLRQARELGVPVDDLALPSEREFVNKLQTNKPNVGIVQLRHDLSHGNIMSFIASLPGTKVQFFTPECLREVADMLVETSSGWTEKLSSFRSKELQQRSS